MTLAWWMALGMPLFAVWAQEAQTPIFQSESALALVRFHVERKHSFADDIQAGDVILLEDGRPRSFTVFEGSVSRTIPIEMALLFDTSGSVNSEGLLDPLEYKAALLDKLPGVRLSVYSFNDKLFRHCRPTRDGVELATALGQVRESRSKPMAATMIALQLPRGRKGGPATWLFEAIMATARDGAPGARPATRMLVVFSDGFPTTNTRPEEAAAALSEMGVPAYPVVLGHSHIAARKADGQLGWPQMAELFMADFARLAELTGGRSFDPPAIDVTVVRQILAAMTAQALSEYVVGFTPEALPGGARKHRLEVRLRTKNLGTVRGGVRTVTH